MSARLFREPEDNWLQLTQPASGDDSLTTPFISPDLIDYLQVYFPDRLPPQDTTIRELDVLIGQQEVINHLLGLFHAQKEKNT
jgi:hypothetical protein